MKLSDDNFGESTPILGKHGEYGALTMPDGVPHDAHGSTISFHDINYSAMVKTQPCCGKSERKVILKDINGVFRQGMNAILGPTGSGKSSLLDVLAGRKDKSGLTGEVLIDGHKQPENFKCMAGYVVQDDILMGTLTVRENLTFSATLRCPKMSLQDKEKRVQDIIDELGLQKCADSKVGTQMIRGISGGEKKRTSIGRELITFPGVLFLDEPTTGLDASTASSVMLLLHNLSRRGRTVIFSIHQPRYSIFKQFDTLLLLSAGETVYKGAADDSIEYFKQIGYQIEEYNNPPDFFLDVINGMYEVSEPDAASPNGNVSSHLLDQPQQLQLPDVKVINSDEEKEAVTENRLAAAFQNSSTCQKTLGESRQIHKDYEKRVADGTEVPLTGLEYARSWGIQWSTVSKRALLNLIRNPQTSVYQLVVSVIFGLVVGTIYFQMDTSLQSGVQNRVGVFFFIIMNMVFSNMSATELFIHERALFIHENVSGFYRVSAYFLAKVFCDILPTRCIPAFFFAPIVYFMVGLDVDVVKFFTFVLTLILTTLAACGIAFTMSSTFDIVGIANLFISLTYVFMMVFSGLLVNLETISVWLRWLRYISLFRYGIAALSVNELKDMEFCESLNGTDICQMAGNAYMKAQGIAFETSWDLWQNLLALGAITVIMLFLSYVQLIRLKKLK
ncbi:broad substrate specificity ATP-binding cassette transporter ABCG2-like isoform X2 [Tubulanus polymorphus]|uniref:broad substrate specificity ATP-binding cassette transporter ABCG2-like isoform X2 n=1 Tax=Tubulanus polymorphus TaxID=672921 RepID=UPI003DA5364B